MIWVWECLPFCLGLGGPLGPATAFPLFVAGPFGTIYPTGGYSPVVNRGLTPLSPYSVYQVSQVVVFTREELLGGYFLLLAFKVSV